MLSRRQQVGYTYGLMERRGRPGGSAGLRRHTTLLLRVAGELSESSGAVFPALRFGGRETLYLQQSRPLPSPPGQPGELDLANPAGTWVGCSSSLNP